MASVAHGKKKLGTHFPSNPPNIHLPFKILRSKSNFLLKISVNSNVLQKNVPEVTYFKINSVNQQLDGFKTEIREMEERVKLLEKHSRECK
jgi:hypothetical protein